MMTPNVKRSDIIIRISVILIIGCMVTGGGCSKPPRRLLTAEIAKKYVDNPFSVDTGQFTSIEDAAAEALGEHQGPLGLGGLRQLSDTQAKALGKYEGRLDLFHDKLPPSASKILKDAGHE